MEKQFKYDAFISYRHAETDKFVAENLHRQLEAFRLPRSIAKKRQGEKTKIERVFRDKEELPLTSNLEDPIVDALKSSEWLIVICSPRLRESLWCKKEIETFVQLRGRERVLAVLIEGEPSESFPDELLYETKTETLADGTVQEIKVPVEPLAADVRGKTKKEMMKAMKTEILRLLAAMFQLSFDDLRQRHKEQRMRRIVTASLIGGAACLLFGVYSTATALQIKSQKEQIETQAEEIKKQNEDLALRQAYSLAELAEQYLEDGNRRAAIEIATEALTESEGISLPYTPEAQYVLAESLQIYDTGNVYKANYQYETAGRIDGIKESPDSDTLVIFDDTKTLTLFDVETGSVIKQFGVNEYDFNGIHGCTFVGNDYFVYADPDKKIFIYDLNTGEIIKELVTDTVTSLMSDKEGNYLAVNQWGNDYVIFDGHTWEELGTTPDAESDSVISEFYIFPEGILAYAVSKETDEGETYYTMHFVDFETMEVFATYELGMKKAVDMQIRNGIAYIATTVYSEDYMSKNAYLSTVCIATGELLWEYEQKGMGADRVVLPWYEQAEDLLFATRGNMILLNMQTGEITTVVALDSPVVEANVYTDSATFLVFCESGSMMFISEEDACKYDMSYKFECKTISNEHIFQSKYGITALQYNDNKITVYTSVAGPDVVVVEESHELPAEKEYIEGDEAIEIAKSYGLERAEYVSGLYYSDDKEYCFIQYWDSSCDIYQVSEKKLCHTIKDAYPTEWYVGVDSEGYTYILGYYGCYMLDQNMKPVVFIKEVTEIDIEQRKVYLNWNDLYYEAPIYSTEELLAMAETYLQQ